MSPGLSFPPAASPEPASSPLVSIPPTPLVPIPPAIAFGYALPVPVRVVAADPRLIGEGSPGPRQTEPAGPVTLPVAPGTAVDAVTAGTLTVIPAGGGTSTIVLSGADGAAYTYRDVTASRAPRTTVNAGTQIGVSGPGGLTFSISVPDVRGAVDARTAGVGGGAQRQCPRPALHHHPGHGRAGPQAGAAGDRRRSGPGRRRPGQVGGRPTVTVQASTVGDTRSRGGLARAARRIAASGRGRLVVVVLAHGTPALAAALVARLPAGRDLLWVAPPGTTPEQAAAYREIVAARPGFRVESLPAALAAVDFPAASAASWSPAGALATATMVAAYASTAYRLGSVPAPARTVVSWAEQQLGKPYQWGAAGPGSFDCSGLTMAALAQAGITVPHNANAQWQQTKAHPVAGNQLAPGDLVFYAGPDGSLTAPGHVGIYVGNGEIIDAPDPGANVRFDPLTSISGYVGAAAPYAATPAAAPAPVLTIGNLAAPAGLNQYLSFAQTLAGTTWGPGQFPYLNLLWDRESRLEPRRGQPGLRRIRPPVTGTSSAPHSRMTPYSSAEPPRAGSAQHHGLKAYRAAMMP